MNTGTEQDTFYRLKILQCDTESQYTGRIYPREDVQKAIDKHQIGYGILADQETTPPTDLPLHLVSHKVLNMEIDESGAVWCDVEIMPSVDAGEKVMALLEHIRLSPVMTGMLTEEDGKHVVSDITMCYTAFVMKDPITIEAVIAGEYQ